MHWRITQSIIFVIHAFIAWNIPLTATFIMHIQRVESIQIAISTTMLDVYFIRETEDLSFIVAFHCGTMQMYSHLPLTFHIHCSHASLSSSSGLHVFDTWYTRMTVSFDNRTAHSFSRMKSLVIDSTMQWAYNKRLQRHDGFIWWHNNKCSWLHDVLFMLATMLNVVVKYAIAYL